MKVILQLAGVLSFLLCFTGGMWLFAKSNFTKSEDALPVAMGLYFMGKAFFVGPMLFAAAQKCGPKNAED